jgi:hypothetical protein
MSTFARELQDFKIKCDTKSDALVSNIVVRVAARLDQRSPVGDASYWISPPPKGYVGGRFRGSWNLGVDSFPAPVETIDPSGASTQGRIIASIPEQASGNVFYLINATPYGQRIEDGWSRQAPQGLVGLTAIEFQGIVNEAVGALAA